MNRRGFLRLVGSSGMAAGALADGSTILSIALIPVGGLGQTYCVKTGSLREVTAVRDGGMRLTILSDETCLYNLTIADIPPGCARTSVRQGFVRLGYPPVFPVTLDGAGDGLEQRPMKGTELAGAVLARDPIEPNYLSALSAAGLLVN